MGSLSSVIAPIVSTGKYLMSNTERMRDIDTSNIKAAQAAQNDALQKQANLLALQQKETDRLSKLRRSIATQRANFGSQGVGSVTGSADSVFQGINEASDIERQGNIKKTAMDNAIIDQNLKSQQQLNLLQKQQFKQKAALGVITDLLG
jgi:hypothetical protein